MRASPVRVPIGDAGDVAEAPRSAVAWPAIFAGAVAAIAVSLLLLTLGSGIGLSSGSFWPGQGATLGTLTVWAAVWLIIVQWAASGLGGYITGRLRTKWVSVHNDEVLFRDTAHGFLSWAVATALTAMLIASTASSIVAGGARAVTSVASGAAQGASQGAAQSSSPADPTGYLVNSLFRSSTPNPADSAADVKAEAGRIIVSSLRSGSMSPADRTYLAQLAAARTGISPQEAEKRVDDVIARAKDAEAKVRAAADEARKSAAKLSYFTAFSLLIGAFIACVAAAIGGRQRDDW